nr:hypothetical protein BaRGS_034158 [Batillaria attramentaria]
MKCAQILGYDTGIHTFADYPRGSHGQSRITRYGYSDDFYTNMMLDAFPMWSCLEKEAGVQIFKECGVLNLGNLDGDYMSSLLASIKRHNVDHTVLQPADVRRDYPMFTYPDNYGGVMDKNGGILLADRAVAAFQSVFKQYGGEIRDGEPVTAVTPGEPLVTVTTSKGSYRGKKVVLAAGPWASKLLRPLGLDLPLRPIRITVCYWKEKEEGSLSSERLPCFIDEEAEGLNACAYGLPSDEYPGYVKVCVINGPDSDPDQRDTVDDTWLMQDLAAYVRRHLSCLHDNPGITEACMHTMTPDHNPVLDKHPQFNNIVIAAGFSGHGFKLAPAIGKAVSELVLDKPPSYTMDPFVLTRFQK